MFTLRLYTKIFIFLYFYQHSHFCPHRHTHPFDGHAATNIPVTSVGTGQCVSAWIIARGCCTISKYYCFIFISTMCINRGHVATNIPVISIGAGQVRLPRPRGAFIVHSVDNEVVRHVHNRPLGVVVVLRQRSRCDRGRGWGRSRDVSANPSIPMWIMVPFAWWAPALATPAATLQFIEYNNHERR